MAGYTTEPVAYFEGRENSDMFFSFSKICCFFLTMEVPGLILLLFGLCNLDNDMADEISPDAARTLMFAGIGAMSGVVVLSLMFYLCICCLCSGRGCCCNSETGDLEQQPLNP